MPLILESAGHSYIGSEHLLLGLLREGEGVAARVLENLGADPSNIRTQVIKCTILESQFFCSIASHKMLNSDYNR
jgi:ATP-dependent Clp protease ATP-binding subunit ClpA